LRFNQDSIKIRFDQSLIGLNNGKASRDGTNRVYSVIRREDEEVVGVLLDETTKTHQIHLQVLRGKGKTINLIIGLEFHHSMVDVIKHSGVSDERLSEEGDFWHEIELKLHDHRRVLKEKGISMLDTVIEGLFVQFDLIKERVVVDRIRDGKKRPFWSDVSQRESGFFHSPKQLIALYFVCLLLLSKSCQITSSRQIQDPRLKIED